SGNRGISCRESIEKGSVPERYAIDLRVWEISRNDSDIAEQQYVTGMKLRLIVFSLTLACFLMTLSSSVLATAIPRITSEFHSVEDIGWYGSAYLLSSCAMQPLSGKLYTYFSLKHTFLCFLVTFELGALICGLSKDSNMLIVGRAIQGCGGSGILNGALTILAAAAPISKRPSILLSTLAYLYFFLIHMRVLLGIIMSTASIGQVIGPLIGGALTQHASWRVISRLGYFTPWAIVGCVCSAIGSGCMSLLNVNTEAGEWIGFQILVGAGRGMVSQMPITAIQNSLPATDIAIGSSLATFSGYFGSAIFLSFASTIFTNSLANELAIYVPNIDTEAIVASGATELRDLVKGAELEAVLIAYNESLIRCFFWIGVGTVKKKNEKQEGDQEGLEDPAKNKSPESTVMEGKA
ncbi:efflux pump, partial [Botrytis cinerea]